MWKLLNEICHILLGDMFKDVLFTSIWVKLFNRYESKNFNSMFQLTPTHYVGDFYLRKFNDTVIYLFYYHCTFLKILLIFVILKKFIWISSVKCSEVIKQELYTFSQYLLL